MLNTKKKDKKSKDFLHFVLILAFFIRISRAINLYVELRLLKKTKEN